MKGSVLWMLMVFFVGGLLTGCVSSSKYKKLQAEYESAKESHKKRVMQLKEELSACQKETAELKTALSKSKTEAELARKDAQAAQEMQAMKEKQMQQIKEEIVQAFPGVGASDLYFVGKNGNVVLNVGEDLLFRKGRADLTSKGKKTVKSLAEIFKKHPELKIIVLGHTDKDPIRKTKYLYKDNWDLSVARASTVVRELLKNGVEPERLTAAGKGDTQATDDAKSSRRVEFALDVDEEKLLKVIKSIK